MTKRMPEMQLDGGCVETRSVLSGAPPLVLGVLGVLMLGACSLSPQAQMQKYMSNGAKYATEGKPREAVIQFRNAVELDPKSAAAHYQLARTYLGLNNTEGAFKQLKEVAALDPANSDAQLQLASLMIIRREYNEAQTVLRKVLKTNTSNTQVNARAHAMLGERFAATRNISEAVQELEKAIALAPERQEFYEALGAIHVAVGNAADAEATYLQGVEANPKSALAHLDLAQFYQLQGKYPQAEVEVRTAIRMEPTAIQARLLLIRFLDAAGRPGEAEKASTELKTIAPNEPEAYMALGLHYIAVGRKDQAATEFGQLARLKPADLIVKRQLLDLLVDSNRLPEARQLSEQLLQTDKDNMAANLAKGRILQAEDRHKEAMTVLEKAAAAPPPSAQALYYLGVSQAALGFSNQAKGSYTKALSLQPQLLEASLALARLATASGDNATALRLAGDMLNRNPNLPAAYAIRAQALLSQGAIKEAEVALQEALKRDPALTPALTVLLNLRVRQGRAQELVLPLTKLVENQPQSADLRHLLALAYFSVNNLPRSEENVRAALKLDPKTATSHSLLANIHLAKGATSEAKTELLAAIAAEPHTMSNYMMLELEYEREGNWQEAIKLCERARQLDPDSAAIANQLAYLYLEHGGDANQALVLAQQAKQKMPNSPNVADTLGWAYYKLKMVEPAIVQFKLCTEFTPVNPTCQYHLGLAYLGARNLTAAQKTLQLALANPNFQQTEPAKAALAQIPARSR